MNSALASGPLGGRYKTRTPLHVVTDWPGYFPNGPEIVRILTAAGANINQKDDNGLTPLMIAAQHGDLDMVTLLLARGADPNLRSYDGKSARDLVLSSHQMGSARSAFAGQVKLSRTFLVKLILSLMAVSREKRPCYAGATLFVKARQCVLNEIRGIALFPSICRCALNRVKSSNSTAQPLLISGLPVQVLHGAFSPPQ